MKSEVPGACLDSLVLIRLCEKCSSISLAFLMTGWLLTISGGSGRIENGQFESDDIKMQALAGDMFITGSANLVNETVDAKVKFLPDFTSGGIPVLTAFAVAPQTAIFVFAISTALSPVLDVFTQINYAVKGPIDSPTVTEKSRFTGEYTLPEKLKEQQNQPQ